MTWGKRNLVREEFEALVWKILLAQTSLLDRFKFKDVHLFDKVMCLNRISHPCMGELVSAY